MAGHDRGFTRRDFLVRTAQLTACAAAAPRLGAADPKPGMPAGYQVGCYTRPFDQFEYREQAPTFRRLAEAFELCVYGLNLVKQDLERYQGDYYRRLASTLDANPA